MTMQSIRDEFWKLRGESEDFARKYANTSEGFQKYLDDFCLGSDD